MNEYPNIHITLATYLCIERHTGIPGILDILLCRPKPESDGKQFSRLVCCVHRE